MASDEFVLAINPDPTQPSICLEKDIYDLLHEVITDNLLAHGPMTLAQLGVLAEEQLQDAIDGPVMWYCTIVKLDMEARGEIRRAPKFNQDFGGGTAEVSAVVLLTEKIYQEQ